MRFLGRSVYARGAKRFTVNRGDAAHLVIRAEDIAAQPDLSAVPEGARPVMNPDVFRAADDLRHELANLRHELRLDDGPVSASREERVRKLSDSLDEALRHATLLVPVDEGTNTVAMAASRLARKIGIAGYPVLNIKGVVHQPVFTDWAELRKMFPQERYGATPMSLSDLAGMSPELIIINAASLGVAFPKSVLIDMLR